MKPTDSHTAKTTDRLTRFFRGDTTRALLKALSSPGNRFLLGAAFIPLILALTIPLINVYIIYPAFTHIIVKSIEEDANRLAKHEIPSSLKHTELTKETLTDRFFGNAYKLELDFGLYKLRVYSPQGEILYSTKTEEIGAYNTSTYFRETVGKGENVTSLVTTDTNDIEGNPVTLDVVNTYVPIMRGNKFLGAFEMHYDISDRTERLDQLTLYSQIAMLTLSATLVLSVIVLLWSVAAHQIARDKAEELKNDVESITRHDLKTPLIALSNGIAYLENYTELNEEQAAMTGDMREAASKAMDIINRSLDLYKMEKGTYNFAPDDMDLLTMLDRVRGDLSRLAQENGIELRIMLGESEASRSNTIMIESEEALCYSLMANLIKNAIEASSPGHRVTATISKDDGFARLVIHNPAPVPEEVRDSFFDKYATSGKSGGTGLGTYSARLLTETLGGTITMDTSEEEGTTVTVSLPVVAAMAKNSPQE